MSQLGLLVLGYFFFDEKAGKEERRLTERHAPYPDCARSVRKLIPWVY